MDEKVLREYIKEILNEEDKPLYAKIAQKAKDVKDFTKEKVKAGQDLAQGKIISSFEGILGKDNVEVFKTCMLNGWNSKDCQLAKKENKSWTDQNEKQSREKTVSDFVEYLRPKKNELLALDEKNRIKEIRRNFAEFVDERYGIKGLKYELSDQEVLKIGKRV